MTIQHYRPRSTLQVPETQVTRAKFPFIDVHSHQRVTAAPDDVDAISATFVKKQSGDKTTYVNASIDEQALGGHAPDDGIGEPLADLTVRSSELRGVDLAPSDVAAAIDEIPVLCLAGAMARGTTTIRGAGELRVKESDRLAGIVAGLTALGARVEVDGDDLTIEGRGALRGAALDSLDDHRLAMTFAIAGLVATGETAVRRPASAAISYPAFFSDLEGVRA